MHTDRQAYIHTDRNTGREIYTHIHIISIHPGRHTHKHSDRYRQTHMQTDTYIQQCRQADI